MNELNKLILENFPNLNEDWLLYLQIGFISLIVFIISVIRIKISLLSYKKTTARIIGLREGVDGNRTSILYNLAYRDDSGAEFTQEDFLRKNFNFDKEKKVGDEVKILYHKNNPQKIKYDYFHAIYQNSEFFGIFALMMIGLYFYMDYLS